MKKHMKLLSALILILVLAGSCLSAGASGAPAAGYDLLGGTWSVGATTHNGRIFDIHDVDGLEDLYDTLYIWFDEDGTFSYFNLFYSQGNYVPFKENSYLLKTQSTYRFKTTDEGIEKEETTSEKKTTYLVEFMGDTNTLRFGILDPISGKIKADYTPLYLVKDGCESEYIAAHKVQVSNSNSSKGKNSNVNRSSTLGERNALKRAKEYLSVLAFSYTGLIDQLEYEGFTHSEATYGANNCGANWNAQAAKKAANYLDIFAFSRVELIDQLEFDGFTHDEAVYGAKKNGY